MAPCKQNQLETQILLLRKYLFCDFTFCIFLVPIYANEEMHDVLLTKLCKWSFWAGFVWSANKWANLSDPWVTFYLCGRMCLKIMPFNSCRNYRCIFDRPKEVRIVGDRTMGKNVWLHRTMGRMYLCVLPYFIELTILLILTDFFCSLIRLQKNIWMILTILPKHI